MTEEQKKVRKFYKDFQGWKVDTVGTWIGAGFLVLLLVISCSIPAQEMLQGGSGDAGVLGWIMALMFGPLAGFLYLNPYMTYTEMVSTNQPKTVRIIDKLKYLPIDLKEIRKMKVTYLMKFFAKIAPVCLILQILTSLYSYGKFTWVNVVYILALAFVWPVVANLPMILAERDVEIPISRALLKNWVWIVPIIFILLLVGYMFFPWNVKNLLLQGADEQTATIIVTDVSDGEAQKYELTGEKREALLELFERNYVRIKPSHDSYISEHFIGYYISVSGNEDMLFFFSEKILSMGGQQYLLYGDEMAQEFLEIMEEE